jgi:hypothetical protein
VKPRRFIDPELVASMSSAYRMQEILPRLDCAIGDKGGTSVQ